MKLKWKNGKEKENNWNWKESVELLEIFYSCGTEYAVGVTDNQEVVQFFFRGSSYKNVGCT